MVFASFRNVRSFEALRVMLQRMPAVELLGSTIFERTPLDDSPAASLSILVPLLILVVRIG